MSKPLESFDENQEIVLELSQLFPIDNVELKPDERAISQWRKANEMRSIGRKIYAAQEKVEVIYRLSEHVKELVQASGITEAEARQFFEIPDDQEWTIIDDLNQYRSSVIELLDLNDQFSGQSFILNAISQQTWSRVPAAEMPANVMASPRFLDSQDRTPQLAEVCEQVQGLIELAVKHGGEAARESVLPAKQTIHSYFGEVV